MDKNSPTITQVLNYRTSRVIRWCTPSIDQQVTKVFNPYKSDMSISYESLGFPSTPSGIFETAYRRAARAYGADYSLFSVNGSTGSNFVVLRALSKQIPNLRILAQRNVHKSVVVACEDYNINLIFLPPNIDEHLQIFLPNTIEEIVEAVTKTKPQAVLLTNPTYDGIVLDLDKLITTLRRNFPNLIIFIEEAWGSHLHFSKKLPVSAMEAGADICIQSTHKQGGALTQGGMIHWKKGKINTEIMLESFRGLSTSSPSYILLASLDAARQLMEERGGDILDRIIDVAKFFEEELEKIPGIEIADAASLRKKHKSVFANDKTKIIVDVSKTGLDGFKIARELEEKYKIIVEKYNTNELLFLVPLSATQDNVRVTVKALKEIVNNSERGVVHRQVPLEIPRRISKILEVGDVSRLLWNQIEKVPLKESVGRISAENITPYPPGIPTTIKGEEFTEEIVAYYLDQKEYPNSHMLAQDPNLETVLAVK
jgi:arginine decarboxylase